MKLKRITSLCLTWSFIILVFSSLVLYVLPSGRVAHWANWAFLGLEKDQWAALHTNNGYLFLVACVLHIYFNFSHILNYMKNRKRELTGMNINSLIAFVLVLLIAVFTLVELPPVSWIQDLNAHFKRGAETKYGIPPYGHAEQSSLQEFARRTGLDLDESLSKLRAAGYEGIEPGARLEDIAAINGVSPQTLVRNLGVDGKRGGGKGRSHEESAGGRCSGSESPQHEQSHQGQQGGGSGYGQQTLESVCNELGLDANAMLLELKAQGYKGSVEDRLKTIADSKGERPSAVVQLLHEIAGISHE